MDEPSFFWYKNFIRPLSGELFLDSVARESDGVKGNERRRDEWKTWKMLCTFFSVFSNKNCYVCTNRVRACARCGCCCLSDDCVDRTAAIDSLWLTTMKCISTISIFLDQVPLIGNNFLQHSSSLCSRLPWVNSNVRPRQPQNWISLYAPATTWCWTRELNELDRLTLFFLLLFLIRRVHPWSVSCCSPSHILWIRSDRIELLFFPIPQHPPSPPAWPKASVWYHISPSHHQKMPSKQPYNLVKEDQPDFKNIYPDEAFLKGISFNVKVTIDVPHFSLAAIFILWFFSFSSTTNDFLSLFTPQLIGFQEVQRPTSRTEIVQAMRRIRVS